MQSTRLYQKHKAHRRGATYLLGSILAITAVSSSAQAQQLSNELYFNATSEDKLSLYGNRLGETDMYGLGVEASTLYYKSYGSHRWYINTNANGGTSAAMTLAPGGKLGIGTSAPDHELVVQGDDPSLQIRDDVADNSANAARLELLERGGGSFNGGAFFSWNGDTNKLLIGTKSSGVNTNVLVVDRATESVGIGTQNPGLYRLAVNGGIRAKEIVVESGWADYVFEEDYQLRPLEDVSRFIKENGHLPDIPSAAEVAAKGVPLGEMNTRLLQKVEELTLYMIDLKREVDELKSENVSLKRSVKSSKPGRGVME